jgi:hypothetical protein
MLKQMVQAECEGIVADIIQISAWLQICAA